MLDFIYNKKHPKLGEYFSYICDITKISINYGYPDKYELQYLAMEYLGKIIFKILTPDNIIDFIFKILAEYTIIFISENLENLTAIV